MPTDPGQPRDPPPPPVGPDPPERPATTEPLTIQLAWLDAMVAWADATNEAWDDHTVAVREWAMAERARMMG